MWTGVCIPDEPSAIERVFLPRPFFPAPDVPLVHVADCGICCVPAFPAVRRSAVVGNGWVAVLSYNSREYIFIEDTGRQRVDPYRMKVGKWRK